MRARGECSERREECIEPYERKAIHHGESFT